MLEETEQLMHTTNNKTSKIQELESELKQKDTTVDTLEAKVKDLEQRLYPKGWTTIIYTEYQYLIISMRQSTAARRNMHQIIRIT